MVRSDEPTLRRPSIEDIKSIANESGMDLNGDELNDYYQMICELVGTLEEIEESPDPSIGPGYTIDQRPPHHRPDNDEDPYNVWISKFEIVGGNDGLLDGLEIGLKDNIAVAGYPMTAGSKLLEYFNPSKDATVVTRILQAGGNVVGKLNMDSFASAGSGEVSDFGPIINPHDTDYLAGGSSGGGGAAPVLGECDISIGSDQGGSIRIPASWCGAVGLKPTRGLVPYTGAIPLDYSFDTLGPIARTVDECARALQVLAGVDERSGLTMDPRQTYNATADDYLENLSNSIEGKRIEFGAPPTVVPGGSPIPLNLYGRP